MSQVKVSSVSQLQKALSVASDGDVILLAPGRYDGLDIKNINFDKTVTIASEIPNDSAILSDIGVINSSGIEFRSVEFVATDKSPLGTITIKSSENISVTNSYIHGSEDGNPSNDSDGIRIVDSKDVEITNSEFNELRIAIGHANSRGIKVSDNHIHDIRMDGIRGSGSSKVSITGNSIHDFYRAEGDHADAIQFYTSASNPIVRDIDVSSNLIYQGDGLALQGVFMRNTSSGLFDGVNIKDNVIIGGNHNAIFVEYAKGVDVIGNEVHSMGSVTSWVRIIDVDGLKSFNNEARQFIEVGVANGNFAGNVLNDVLSGSFNDLILAWKNALTDKDAGGGVLEPSKPVEPVVEGEIVSANKDIQFAANDDGAKLTGVGDWQVVGNAHDNEIHGNSGNNVLRGAAGADTLDGREGADVLDGGAGSDTASYAQATLGVAVNLSVTGPQDTLGAGVDRLVSIENLVGSRNADTLSGSNGANEIRGAAGDDVILGGGGADVLEGGGGADRFVYRSVSESTVAMRDTILDFRPAKGDLIDLSAIDARLGGRDDAFVLVTTFSGRAGQLTVTTLDDRFVVSGDVDGDGRADIAIDVYSSHTLSSGSFVL